MGEYYGLDLSRPATSAQEAVQWVYTVSYTHLDVYKRQGQDNSKLLGNGKTINISIKEDNTALNLIFLNRSASYNNTFGYYFYLSLIHISSIALYSSSAVYASDR